ncbi:hypothetical protein BH09BAC5_BH09BAC5_26810 [soil metagenome]
MKLLQNSKFTGPALLLLLILNSALLVLILMKHPPRPGDNMRPPMMGQEGPREFLIHELKLNENQQKAYSELIEKHKAAMEILQHDMQSQREGLIDLLGSADSDSSKMNAFVKKIGEDQLQIEKLNFEHFKALRNVCNAEQQLKFDSIIKEALRMIGPQVPPNGPRGMPGQPQGPPPPNGEGPPPPPEQP